MVRTAEQIAATARIEARRLEAIGGRVEVYGTEVRWELPDGRIHWREQDAEGRWTVRSSYDPGLGRA